MTTHQTVSGLTEAKQQARRTWATGDFAEVARLTLWPVGERLVRRVGVGRGETVLDVACGTGNAALRAAQAGGRTTGVDLTPELFDEGRALAAEAGVEIEWVEGDAEDLPFADATFDVVLSTFGVMFAPRHRIAADELVRVLRPDGRFGLTTWTPEGVTGRMFRALGAYAPPAPPFAAPPLLWGDEEHVHELFAGSGVTLEFARETAPPPPFATADEMVGWSERTFGPVIMLKAALEARGEWEACRRTLLELFDPTEGAEYLVITGRKES
jgi:SAM-dependent methyltransferase